MVEGIEGGDAAGAGRLAGEGWWWAGGCGAGVLVWALGGGPRAGGLLDFWRRKQRRNQYNVQSSVFTSVGFSE